MSFCDLALAIGLTLNSCPQTLKNDALPENDRTAWEYKKPEPAPSLPPPVVANFPPVILKEVKEIKVEVPVPAPLPSLPPPPKPDETASAVKKIYESRAMQKALVKVGGTGLDKKTELSALNFPNTSDLPKMKVEGTYLADKVTSGLPVDNSRKITTDRYITGILETGINSQLSGEGSPVVIQVSRNVFGYHGRNVLIPKGSRLVCSYGGPNKQGLSRSEIRCERIFLAGNRAEIYQIKTIGTDQQGHVGVSGELDNRFWERYGTAFMLAGISAAVRAASQTGQDTAADNSSAIVTTGAEELSQRFGEITAQMLEQNVNLKPILLIPQGTRLQLRPQTDWYIAKMGE